MGVLSVPVARKEEVSFVGLPSVRLPEMSGSCWLHWCAACHGWLPATASCLGRVILRVWARFCKFFPALALEVASLSAIIPRKFQDNMRLRDAAFFAQDARNYFVFAIQGSTTNE
jgi:hypothetical protein